MSIDTMVQEGRIHRFKATRAEISRVMSIARRDLAEAERIIATSLDWSYSIAYNAVLQACRAYMFHLGYRPATAEAHKATFDFMKLTAEEGMKQTIDYFDRARQKRHRVIYDEPGLVSESEVQQLVTKAKQFLEYVDGALKRKNVE